MTTLDSIEGQRENKKDLNPISRLSLREIQELFCIIFPLTLSGFERNIKRAFYMKKGRSEESRGHWMVQCCHWLARCTSINNFLNISGKQLLVMKHFSWFFFSNFSLCVSLERNKKRHSVSVCVLWIVFLVFPFSTLSWILNTSDTRIIDHIPGLLTPFFFFFERHEKRTTTSYFWEVIF